MSDLVRLIEWDWDRFLDIELQYISSIEHTPLQYPHHEDIDFIEPMLLAKGTSRLVYQYANYPDYIVKVAFTTDGCIQNYNEWIISQDNMIQ